MSIFSAEMEGLFESLKLQCSLLIASTKIDANGSPDPRDAFVRHQLRCAAVLLSGSVELGKARNAACLGILSRSLLEQLITVSWGIRSVENTEVQVDARPAELAKAFKINLKEGTAKIVDRHTGTDATVDYLASGKSRQSLRRKSVEEQAKEADIMDLYIVYNRFFIARNARPLSNSIR